MCTEKSKEQESMGSGKRSCESKLLSEYQGSFPETEVPVPPRSNAQASDCTNLCTASVPNEREPLEGGILS